ncbi:MAG TPA: peptidoglycan binding domain-containing protein [Thermomicrobiales bacterium]|nr:peptidoglycan binding domain-containing protein [Thermomicrobiales bacterium]
MHVVKSVPGVTAFADPNGTSAGSWRGERVSQVTTSLLVGFFSLFLVAVAAFTAYGLSYSDRAYAGMRLGGVDIGGMTRDDIERVVATQYEDFATTRITLNDGDQEFTWTAGDMGISIDRAATVDRAMNEGRRGSPWERSLAWTRTLVSGNDLTPVLVVDRAAFDAAMQDVASDVVFAPSDARVDVESDGTATLVNDIRGRSLNVSATLATVLHELSQPGDVSAALALIPISAGVTATDLEGGLPGVERALSSSFTLSSEDGQWGLTRASLSELVYVDDNGTMQVRREGVETYVAGIAAQVDHPSTDAAITVDDQGQFVVVPHVVAATVDQAATVDRIVAALIDGEPAAEMVVDRMEPAILTRHAETWAANADVMVGDGLTLSWSGGTSQLGRTDLVAALVITPQPGEDDPFALSIDPDVVAERMSPLQETLYLKAQEAQFRLVDGSIRFQSEARQGREMDMDASVESVVEAISSGDPEAPITVHVIEPTYTSESRSDISLPDVLGVSQTYYGSSSEPRRHNVERAVELEDGWLIPPGGIFSFAAFSGLITEDNGFVTGFGIVADPSGGVTTAPVIGGGICQVSTTIYQASFWAGMKVVERWAHPYWLESYGQAPYGMRGLDAMVNIEPDWALDLKFENTTGNWIAIVMSADGENVHAEIRGTNPGWEIDVPEPEITNVVKPSDEMHFTDSPELPKGQELQVERAKDGFTSTITRTVRDEDGNVIDEYTQESTYAASRNLTLRGTGGEQGNED